MASGFASLARSVLVAVALCGSLWPWSAEAAPASCRRLEATLSASRGGNGALANKFDSAIRRQSDALARTKAAHRAASCGLGLFAGARCKALKATIQRMEDNLAALRVQRAKLQPGLSKRERAGVLAALAAQGCRTATRTRTIEARAPAREPKLPQAAELHGVLRGPVGRLESTGGIGYRPAPGGRAFCVRTCDGYVFPTTRFGDARREQTACQAACPAAETRVFHRHSGGMAEMRAADSGAPYRELPSAFLFKHKSAPTPSWCGCSVQGLKTQQGPATDGSIDSLVDPLATATPRQREPLAPAREIPPERRNVRAVGPKFLPDQDAAAALDAKAPASGPSGS